MSLQVEAYESIMSALYGMPFAEFLGEKDMPEGRTGWFHLGEHPKDIRVGILIPEKRANVEVKVEWRNYFADGRNPLKGEQTLTVSTYGKTKADVAPATQEAVVRVLEVYKDVLSEEGVAGKIADLVEAEDSETED